MELGYSGRGSYIESHLQFIIDNWLNNDLKITQFPCQLMDYKTITEFFQWVLTIFFAWFHFGIIALSAFFKFQICVPQIYF